LASDISNSEVHSVGYLFRSDHATARSGGILLYVKHSLRPSELYTKATFWDQMWWYKVGD